ncbi:nitrate reductase cytochrome c-type subunit [Sulfurimonas sp.]|uniref:nitrate reductase cytochrome c-type subunit n=1 Tax=Sulfurimonas sp. TaxID=2022749 RepID=UPI0025E20504|nr:nitrate reductase cytochrome c-type subunit [Sulfurimonas sp.]
MKTMSKITIGLVAATLLIVGCGDSGKAAPTANAKVAPTITEASLGLRKTDLYSEDTTVGDMTMYNKSAAGSSMKIKRAFQDAPPMIPHDVEGMLPIKIGNNACISCHAPEVAPSMNALPYPESHMTNFRAVTSIGQDGRITKNGVSVDNTSTSTRDQMSVKKTSHLQGARFNCNQCHAPQSESKILVENNFEATYTRESGATKSGWNGTALTDQLDTIKGEAGKVTAADIANANSAAGSLAH